jgi:iron complex transport system substrate-binding protein
MSRVRKLAAVSALTALVVTAAACGSDDDDADAAASSTEAVAATDAPATDDPTTTAEPATDGTFPVTVEHALGTTVIESKPERVATVQWANHEVPLALGVVPVGMAAANFGDPDGDGVLPWVSDELEELGAEVPVLFDENDGIDFEAVADTEPDVILAAYSGLTQEDYDTLSEIAPTIAYPNAPWATAWRDMIRLNSAGMGMVAEGEALIAEIEAEIAEAVAGHPELAGKQAMFAGHLDPADLSEVGFYTAHDTRVQFFEDLGLEIADVVAEASAETDSFSEAISTEQIQVFDDVDIIVGYGDETGELLGTLQADPLASKIPALQRGSVVFFEGSTPLATAANPTPLAISYVLGDYVALLGEAAAKVE